MKKPLSEPSSVTEPYKAPAIKGLLADGTLLSASATRGRWTVLYFYPKDLTPGCTAQAEDFQHALASFARLGADVVGVSRDSCQRHETFASKHGLRFALVSDEQGELCESFGVWKEKRLYGRTYMGIERSTFIVNPKGYVVAEWRGVKVPGHVEAVLSTLKGLVAAKA